MLLAYADLIDLVAVGIITNVNSDQINSASIDITLGNTILREQCSMTTVSLAKREPMRMWKDTSTSFSLDPGEFILAQSEQVFNLPTNLSAEYKLKSSMARIGLNHLNAGWCDAGWHSSVLTLELVNTSRYHAIEIKPGDRIGQVVFFSHESVPYDKSYAVRGRYNNDLSVQGIKE